MQAIPKPEPVVLTYEDYLAFPNDGKRYEILWGEVYVNPAPLTVHQRISRNLEFLLHRHVTEQDLGEVLYAPVDVIFGRTDVVQPDLLFVAKSRLAIIQKHGVKGPPDLIVEILSKSTAALDRGGKKQRYAQCGVAHYWIVDPDGCSIDEHLLQGGAYALIATHVGEGMRSRLFPELHIEFSRVFPQGR